MIKIMIADSDPVFKKELTAFISNLGSEFSLCGSFSSGNALLNAIKEKRPDITFINAKLLGVNGLDVIESCNRERIETQFIVLNDSQNFSAFRRALRLGAVDILMKPVTEDDFKEAITHVTELITHKRVRMTINGINDQRRSKLLTDTVFNAIPSRQPSLERINQKYNCQFKEGKFRAVMVRLTSNVKIDEIKRDTSMALIMDSGSKLFTPACHDVIIIGRRLNVLFILNYKPQAENKISGLIEEFASLISSNLDGSELDSTVLVSDSADIYTEIANLAGQCRYLDWARLFLGTGIIITPAASVASTTSVQEKANEYRKALFSYIDDININALKDTFARLFGEPKAFLMSKAAADVVWDIHKYILDKYADEIDASIDIESARHSFDHVLYDSVSPDDILKNLTVESTKYLNIAKENMPSFDEHVVRQTYNYVQHHFAEKISLDRIAEAVSLSPGYFSNYFKKVSGVNFSDYLCTVRVNAAKEMLRNTNKSIGEIAISSGFNDSRYFSKVFHKAVGMTPSKYRNLKD